MKALGARTGDAIDSQTVSCKMNAVNKLMTAPGIINLKYRADFQTKPMKYGMINMVDDYLSPNVITEKERLGK